LKQEKVVDFEYNHETDSFQYKLIQKNE